ncbi:MULTISPECIES: hypothetical protein [unclassified Anabaena]|uniref:hypothetical protein n=1 Tax=unclassified Anabaena TaxID=2619674 RepID=UPI0012E8C98D|nr:MULTISPECIES: hypothetical protein [unclassified Anabaena]
MRLYKRLIIRAKSIRSCDRLLLFHAYLGDGDRPTNRHFTITGDRSPMMASSQHLS